MAVDWWQALVNAGLDIFEQASGQWFAACPILPNGKLGPFSTAEEAITRSVGYLIAVAVDRRDRGDDEPPEPFRKLLG